MDKPADPATPFREVYQHFLTILEKHGRKKSARVKYLYDYRRSERWPRQTGRPVKLASRQPSAAGCEGASRIAQ